MYLDVHYCRYQTAAGVVFYCHLMIFTGLCCHCLTMETTVHCHHPGVHGRGHCQTLHIATHCHHQDTCHCHYTLQCPHKGVYVAVYCPRQTLNIILHFHQRGVHVMVYYHHRTASDGVVCRVITMPCHPHHGAHIAPYYPYLLGCITLHHHPGTLGALFYPYLTPHIMPRHLEGDVAPSCHHPTAHVTQYYPLQGVTVATICMNHT
ncbi:hypothetical protein NP493_1068g00028 [Ridgeia piscesae]|uniref:Uncharacterized protein n=1 Tax=Ridgeia piscesae TaxID=27915 RepID=A0AAD9KHS5_RIDPI|nr:hypothetical protein NP493_1068g00028 [Ridgeia piscesae]